MIDPELSREGEPPLRLRERLADPRPILAAELRPPRRDLVGARAVDAWIDVYHAVRSLSRSDTVVFLTDSAVGQGEEESLAHLTKNIGGDAQRERIAPILTLKHTLEYCSRFADRLRQESFPGLVAVGGDKGDGVPRCLPHAYLLREKLRAEQPGLLLGGWANPQRDPEAQARLVADQGPHLDFVLTQVLSHHRLEPVERFLEELRRLGVTTPVFGGVFFYRSARRATLDQLQQFVPIPREELERDFGERKMSAEEIAAKTVAELTRLGMTRFYVSNLETHRAAVRLGRIARLAGHEPPAPLSRKGGGRSTWGGP